MSTSGHNSTARHAVSPWVAIGVFLLTLGSFWLPAPHWPAIFALTVVIYILLPWAAFEFSGIPLLTTLKPRGESPVRSAILLSASAVIVPTYLVVVLLLAQTFPTVQRAVSFDIRSIQIALASAPVWAIAGGGFLLAWAEEFFFRVFLQNSLQRWGAVSGLLLASLFFALAHHSLGKMLPMFLMGLWFGYLYWRSGSVWTATLGHFIINGSSLVAVFYLQSLSPGQRLVLPEVQAWWAAVGLAVVATAVILLELMFRRNPA